MKKFIYTALFLLGALSIFAQNSDDVEEVEVKGKVLYVDQVNSLKPPLPILDVPQSVSVITDDEIKNQGFREIGDIIRYTPGVNTSQGEGHRDAVVFRGVRSTADFYQDGIRDDVQYYRSLYNVEQLEILRGPNALLFGRGGTGGLINRVTKKAEIGEAFGSFDVGADSFGAADIAVDANFATSENTAVRLNLHTDSLANHRDFYEGERYGINPTVKIQAGDTTVDLSYEYADHERFIDRGIPTANNTPVESLKDVVFGVEGLNLQTLEASILRANIAHDYSDSGKFNMSVTSSDFKKMYKNLYAAGYDGTANTVKLDGYLDPTERQNLILNANVVNEFNNGSTSGTVLVGLEFVDTDNKNYRYNTFFNNRAGSDAGEPTDQQIFNITRPLDISVTSTGLASTVDYTTDLKSSSESDITVTSLYLQGDIDFSDNWKMIIGGRLDNFDITVTDVKKSQDQSRKDDMFSPRFGVIYKPADNMSLYVSYSESFLPRSGEQYKKLDASGAALDPDVFENTEIGYKYDINDALTFTAAIFDSKSTRAEKDNETGEMNEVRGLEVEGVEIELSGDIDDQNNLTFGYTSLDGVTSKGTKQPRELPDQMLSLWYSYQANETIGFGLGVTHQGESFIKDTSNGSTGPALPDYTRVDFALYINASDNDVVRIHVENLTDELYFPHSHSTHQASVGESLNARISYSRRF
ncbi:TonB-dependent siderophore receptor [SAR86 cluster bacterium]|nr:TonB-dependent siderophore receptor [SAR86 cluster bacterium]